MEETTDVCAFCLEEPDTPVIMVNCKHVYCSSCVKKYLQHTKQDRKCPLCRTEINDVDIWRWSTSGLNACTEISHFANDLKKNEFFSDEQKFTGEEVHFQSLYTKESPYTSQIDVKPRSSSWWNGLH